MKDVTPERRGRRALRSLSLGDLAKAELNARKLLEVAPDDASGWAALRGAMAVRGQPADADALRSLAPGPASEARDVLDRVAARRLSRRGLVFDYTEPFRIRRMHDVLDEAPTADALRAGDNLVWFLDRGGEQVEHRPVLDLDGHAGPGFPVRYRTSPKFLTSIRNAAVVGEGLVLTEDGEFVEETHSPSKPAKYGARRRGDTLVFPAEPTPGRPQMVKAYDTPAFLMAGPTDTSFGDFLINFAPRLALYEAAGLDCPILLRWKPLPQVLPILEALGVGRDRLIFHTTDQVSLFPKLFAPCWPSRDKAAPMAGIFDIYRRATVPAGDARPLVFLHRRNVRNRPLRNEEEICELFASRGFSIVDPGAMTFDEVRRLFAGAACVAGGYGSAFHNKVFCRNHPPSLVLMPRHRPYYLVEFAQWHVDTGASFAYVFGDPLEGPPTPQARWTISLDKVERALDRMMELVGSVEPARAD